jgi:hypothetical protein
MPSIERILGNYFSYEPVGVLPFNHSSGRLDCTARTPGLQIVIERVIALEVQRCTTSMSIRYCSILRDTISWLKLGHLVTLLSRNTL